MDRSEEIDRSILKKYEVFSKLGKGVSAPESGTAQVYRNTAQLMLLYLSCL